MPFPEGEHTGTIEYESYFGPVHAFLIRNPYLCVEVPSTTDSTRLVWVNIMMSNRNKNNWFARFVDTGGWRRRGWENLYLQ